MNRFKRLAEKVLMRIPILGAERRSDRDLLYRYVQSVRSPVIDGVRMPGFPAETIQRQFVGSSYEQALSEAFVFYQLVKKSCKKFGRPIGRSTRLIDFGCGWGRIIRFFFKDIDSGNVFGVDVDQEVIHFNRENMHHGQYIAIQPRPPLETFQDGSVDVIYAYSVFSHLAADVATDWINEFGRILKRGGLVLATTQGRGFLDFCGSLKGKDLESPWHRGLAEVFAQTDALKARYDKGEYIFAPTGGGGVRTSDYYGEALVPKQFIDKNWAKHLELCEFFYDTERLPQAFFALRKR